MSKLQDVKSKAVQITLTDGVERELKFTLNAMAELEDKYGSVDEAFDKLEQGSIKAVRFILWAGLMHCEDIASELQVGELIDIAYMNEIMESVGSAFESDMPTPEVKQSNIVAIQNDPN